MDVRRSCPAFSRARALPIALTGVLMLVPLAGCGVVEDAVEQTAVAAPTSPTATDPTSPVAESPTPESPGAPAQAAVEGAVGPLASTAEPVVPPASRPGKKVLEGGGFATAVPGSDAPGRKVEVGPQYAVSADLDIDEVERLVEAVEAIAREQRVEDPLVTGDSVAAAVGTFSYRWFADGSVQPDPAWVAANIRTEQVPILGDVTGHRVMLPQLRGALGEIVARGLSDEIHPEEFGGCYVPRFIARDPGQGLSLHTWGIAVDLNVPGNLRGVAGEIDRTVVAIFKKWGFAWGGDWSYTDPMHFELARIVRAR